MQYFQQYLLIGILILLANSVTGQVHYSKHYDLFPNGSDAAQDAIEYEDRLFVVFQNAKQEDTIVSLMIAELDVQGDILWTNRFPGKRIPWESPMLIENDTIYLFSFVWPEGDKVEMVKLSLEGEILEQIEFSVSAFDYDNIIPRGVLQRSFENKIILHGGGSTGVGDSLELFNFLAAIKFDGTVDTVLKFQTPRGGTMAEVVYNENDNTIHALEDARTRKTTAGGTFPARQLNLYSFDDSLNLINEWNSIVSTNNTDGPPSLEILSTGEIVMAGGHEDAQDRDLWLINNSGEKELLFRFAHTFSPVVDITDIAITSNDDIVVTGALPYRQEITGIDSERLPYLGLFSNEGELLWERLFYYDNAFEEQEYGYFRLNEVLADGSIFVGGGNFMHYEDEENEIRFHSDMWLAKVDQYGCIQDDCDYRVVDIEEQSSNDETTFSVFPNPCSEFINIELENGIGLKNIQIYNRIGISFSNLSFVNKTIDCTPLESGIYWIIAEDNNGKRYQSKFVKI